MDIVERLRELSTYDVPGLKYAADEIERLRGQVEFERASLRSAFDELLERDNEIERLREIISNYERDHSAGAGMAPIRKLGETTVEERSRSTGFSQRSRGYGSEDI